MMRLLDLAAKDLYQILHDFKAAIFLVVMPIVFTLFMGLAYQTTPVEDSGPVKIPLAWVVAAPSDTEAMLRARVAESDTVEVREMGEAEARAALQEGAVAGVLIIPVGFDPPDGQLLLLTDTGTTTGQLLYQTLRRPVTQLFSAAQIATMRGAQVAEGDRAEAQAATLVLAWEQWQVASATEGVMVEAAYATPVEVGPYGDNPYNQASPGILVQFAIFGLVTSAQIIVQERKTGTLQRLVTTGMPAWQIISGHWLAMAALTLLQVALLVVFGQLVVGVDYGRAPLAILLVGLALSAWVASMGLLIGVVAKGEDQVILFSLIGMFLFASLGGTWFPLEGAGAVFATVGRLTPSAWAMIGLQNILIRGMALGSVWQPVAVLMGYAFGFGALAVWLFQRRVV